MIAGCETNFIRILDRMCRASIWWPERKAEARTTAKLNPIGSPSRIPTVVNFTSEEHEFPETLGAELAFTCCDESI
ncbi:hypothetical protein TNCV_4710281 [Trichonephila clavipes]|nr:hypothetical protein TNCV_4710281 [Trichonephila clavipes]